MAVPAAKTDESRWRAHQCPLWAEPPVCAAILGHSNFSMTERFAKLGEHHIQRTGDTARAIRTLMEGETGATAQASA